MTPAQKQAEAARQQRILVAAEKRFAPVVSKAIADDMRRLMDGYRATRSVPSADPQSARDMADAFGALAGVVVAAFADRALDQGKALGLITEAKSEWGEFIARLVAEWIAQEAVRRRITSITETTRAQIVQMVLQGEKAGLGIDAIAASIADAIPHMSRWRGAMIARTETHGAANYGTWQASRASGLEMEREWVSVEDHRTRDFGQGDGVVDEYDHRAMNGQRRGLNEPFAMPHKSGAEIACMYPGDPTLPGGAVINCRCAVVNIVKSRFF